MAIVIQNSDLNTDKNQKRRGFIYAPRTASQNVKDEIILKNQFVIRNRESTIADSSNVVEMYVMTSPREKENYLFIGRSGQDVDQLSKNLNYAEITVDADSTKSPRASNGQASLRISVDKVPQANSGVILAHGSVYGERTGTRASIGGEGDGTSTDIGGAQITYYRNGVFAFGIAVDKDGIQMSGLPTSSAGLVSGAIWNDGGTLKIVS